MWRERDLPEMVSAALAVECWAASVVSGEVSGESSFASIVKLLGGTAEGGRAWFSWPQGWEGSGLAEWACELLLEADPQCPWVLQDGRLVHREGCVAGDAALAKVVSLLAALVCVADGVVPGSVARVLVT